MWRSVGTGGGGLLADPRLDGLDVYDLTTTNQNMETNMTTNPDRIIGLAELFLRLDNPDELANAAEERRRPELTTGGRDLTATELELLYSATADDLTAAVQYALAGADYAQHEWPA